MFTKNIENNEYLLQNRQLCSGVCHSLESVPGFWAELMGKQMRRRHVARTTGASPFADGQLEYAAGHGGWLVVPGGHAKLHVQRGLYL